MEKIYCCECGKDTEYDQGRMVWQSNIDGRYGHKYCVEEYDKKLKEKAAKEESYYPPTCEKCDRELLLSRTKSEEKGYRINEIGESINRYPINLYRYTGNVVERLYCERCKDYYPLEYDDKNRIVKGKMKNE